MRIEQSSARMRGAWDVTLVQIAQNCPKILLKNAPYEVFVLTEHGAVAQGH